MGLERMVPGYASVVATKDKASADLAGEVVILDPNPGVYYGLNDVDLKALRPHLESEGLIEVRNETAT